MKRLYVHLVPPHLDLKVLGNVGRLRSVLKVHVEGVWVVVGGEEGREREEEEERRRVDVGVDSKGVKI